MNAHAGTRAFAAVSALAAGDTEDRVLSCATPAGAAFCSFRGNGNTPWG